MPKNVPNDRLKEIENHFKSGLSTTQVAKVMGLGKSTIVKLKRMIPKEDIPTAFKLSEEHLQFCENTDEREMLKAYLDEGTCLAAGIKIGVDAPTVYKRLRALKSRAALRGYSPESGMVKIAPDPFIVKGVSTLYNNEGEVTAQWVKTRPDGELIKKTILASIEAMAESLPRLEPVPRPEIGFNHLCIQYTVTDYHFGMLAWGKETGSDWDLKIAENMLTEAFSYLIKASPSAHTGIVAQLGDFLHSDGILPVTPTHGHILDQDGRFEKVVSSAVRALRRIVDMALEKHQRVVVLMAEGNHDISSSIWLRTMFQALYENEPRVEVITTPLPYYAHQHGKCMLGFHHGHLKRNEGLPLHFATSYPEMWGTTKHRYAHTGHRHHSEEKEHAGMTVIQHSTLAARDAHAARGGWHSERQMQAITYHADHGIVGRTVVRPEMLSFDLTGHPE